MTLGDANINYTLVSTDDFQEVYSAIDTVKRQVPARVLRFPKEQMYELVKSANPEEKMSVVDIDEIQDKDDVEFVVGVGVAEAHKAQLASDEQVQAETLSKLGYKGITVDDIFADVIKNDSEYDARDLLNIVYPAFRKLPNKYIPAFRYLRAAGVDSKKALEESDFEDAKTIAIRSVERGFSIPSYKAQYERDFAGLSTAEIIEKTNPEKVTIMIPHQPRDQVDLEVLRDFLCNHVDQLDKDPYKSFFRKLHAYYDFLRYGFDL
ncbi:hypothetical protein [Leisingera sp. M658]|uniref:hypothetical protein n=1 Tax=Leisingera sp. M658 TaxID=2867015 RepID=UPI0021A8A8EF|nr:hypothetical protein [Leisingera sp. M658]UWQ74169.1 hypothetical protein K3724_16870 [Leisingera sp. M658]